MDKKADLLNEEVNLDSFDVDDFNDFDDEAESDNEETHSEESEKDNEDSEDEEKSLKDDDSKKDDEIEASVADSATEVNELKFDKTSPKWYRKEVKRIAEEAKKTKLQNIALQKELEEAKRQSGSERKSGYGRPKPSLADYDDEDTYELAMENWLKDQLPAKIELENKAKTYSDRLTRLGGEDAFEAEKVVFKMLGEQSFLHLLEVSNDPAALVLRLSKSSETLSRLAQEKNPAKRLWELSKLDNMTSVKTSRQSTAPVEKRVKSNNVISKNDMLKKQYQKLLNDVQENPKNMQAYANFVRENKESLSKLGIK